MKLAYIELIFKKVATATLSLVFLTVPFMANAEAFDIKTKHTGNWDFPLPGITGESITFWHYDIEKITYWPIFDFNVKGLLFQKGLKANSRLMSLGGGVLPINSMGDELAFDNTMLPTQSGFSTSTNGGTEFKIIFNTPFENPNPESMLLDLSSVGKISISSPLDLADSSLVEAFVIGEDDSLTPVDQVTCADCPKHIPEPTTIIGIFTVLGFGGLLKRESSKKENKS